MEFAYTLADACSYAWGSGGVWLTKDEPWFADDPFVMAHPELFSATPPRVRSTVGRTVEQRPMSAPSLPGIDDEVKAPVRRGRVNV